MSTIFRCITALAAVPQKHFFNFMIIKREKYKKRPAGEIRRPIFTSSFDEYLFLFGKFLFVLLRKGEI